MRDCWNIVWFSKLLLQSKLTPNAHRKAIIVCNFGLSECNRDKQHYILLIMTKHYLWVHLKGKEICRFQFCLCFQ